MTCKYCKVNSLYEFPLPLPLLMEMAKQFQTAHAECSIIMNIKERNRRRYRLHAECRKAGLTVNAKFRDLQGWEENNLPPPSTKTFE